MKSMYKMKGRFYLLAIIAAIVLILSLYSYFTGSFSEKINIQLSYLTSLNLEDCKVITDRFFGPIKNTETSCSPEEAQNESSCGIADKEGWTDVYSNAGDSNLLYAYVELYKITGNETFLKLAEEQANCLENSILPLDFDSLAEFSKAFPPGTSRSEIMEAQGINPKTIEDENLIKWGRRLTALSDFYAAKGESPRYLKEIADFIVKKLDNETFLKNGIIKYDAIRSLVYYYDFTLDKEHLGRAKIYLETVSSSVESMNDLNEILSRSNELDVVESLNFYKDIIATQNKDGSFGEFSDTRVSETLYYAKILDSCSKILKDQDCKVALTKSLNFLMKNVDETGGLLIFKNKKEIGADAWLTILLIKYRNEVKFFV